MYSEAQLIKRITAAIPCETGLRPQVPHLNSVSFGLGDDAAVLSPTGNTDWVLSCDSFVEEIHFLSKTYPPDSVGYKSLARATSDLAAMGAIPRVFLLTLALPASRTGSWLDGFLRGMGRAARELGICLVGGDTTKFSRISISVTVAGEIKKGRALTRSGGRPGDLIYVSGGLGRARLGLELMRHRLGTSPRYRRLLQPHLYPRIRLKLGAWLARERLASAMMDISDGLSTDLARLCESSKVGARLIENCIRLLRIPADPKLAKLKLNPLQMALHGGEDYELLFTVPPKKVALLRKAPGFSELSAVGEITREESIVLVDKCGQEIVLQAEGWDPFRKS
jgi:thiamine-monophosphate kinase